MSLYKGIKIEELNVDNNFDFGYITEILVAKFLGIKIVFETTGNFFYPKYDLVHEHWGKIDCKGSTFHDGGWYFHTLNNPQPDFFFCIGYNKNRTHVVVVYIIPNIFGIAETDTIYISNWMYKERDPYYMFKQNEEEVKKWNDAFNSLKFEYWHVLKQRNANLEHENLNERTGIDIAKNPDAFWKKVEIKGKDECWLWKPPDEFNGKNYGSSKYNNTYIGSHRIAWILTHGNIPEKLLVCHRCDNPRCINPNHLFLGTHSDNMRDMISKGRRKGTRRKIIDGDILELPMKL